MHATASRCADGLADGSGCKGRGPRSKVVRGGEEAMQVWTAKAAR